MRATLLFLAALGSSAFDPAASYDLCIRGAVELTTRGGAEFGAAGSSQEPVFTMTLGGRDGAASVVFTRLGGEAPSAGTYRVGEAELTGGGFSAVIVTGTPTRPTGAFRVRSGTLVITAVATDRMAGRFELQAAGFLAAEPEREDQAVTAVGSFLARAGARATQLTLNRESGQ